VKVKRINYPPEADQPFPPWAGLAEKLTTPEAGEKFQSKKIKELVTRKDDKLTILFYTVEQYP